MANRDIEKNYSNEDFVEKLRRFADCIERGENFRISIAGEELYVPNRAKFNIEHEKSDGQNEIEFQIKWKEDK